MWLTSDHRLRTRCSSNGRENASTARNGATRRRVSGIVIGANEKRPATNCQRRAAHDLIIKPAMKADHHDVNAVQNLVVLTCQAVGITHDVCSHILQRLLYP